MNPKNFAIYLLLIGAMLAAPLATQAFSLVPCGSSEYPEPCQFRHLIILIIRLTNYLISTAAIVAMYHILLSGFNLITALGDPEKIKKNKLGITHAVVGFAIVILAFVFVNLLVNGIFGDPNAPRNWWSPECLYRFNIINCPLGAADSGVNIAGNSGLTGVTGSTGTTAPTGAGARGAGSLP